MTSSTFLRIILVLTLVCAAHPAFSKAPTITYSGGDGSSLEKAVIIKGPANEETGVHAEYDYVQKHYPGYKRGAQSLQNVKGRAYDVLEITTADGRKMSIYFDITAFFGKL